MPILDIFSCIKLDKDPIADIVAESWIWNKGFPLRLISSMWIKYSNVDRGKDSRLLNDKSRPEIEKKYYKLYYEFWNQNLFYQCNFY